MQNLFKNYHDLILSIRLHQCGYRLYLVNNEVEFDLFPAPSLSLTLIKTFHR